MSLINKCLKKPKYVQRETETLGLVKAFTIKKHGKHKEEDGDVGLIGKMKPAGMNKWGKTNKNTFKMKLI